MSSTQHSATHSHAMRFPSVGLEVLSALIHFLGVSILSFLLAKKVHWPDVSSFQGLSRISWPRILVILNVLDSWLFLFSTGLLVNGTGMELSATVCLLGILNCIAFYATSKILIYMFLVEKVYVVWSGAARKKRLRSPVYLACMGVVLMYVGVGIYMIIGRVSYFREDGSCVIGLTRSSSLVLLTYDLFVNIFLTSLFVWPLFHRKFNTSRIRRVAIRTLWAATVALTTSCINILVLTIMHGKQLGWVCLASCGTDVVINSIVLCWVTSGSSGSQGSSVGSRNVTTKELDDDENIIDCSQVSNRDAAVGRRRARSEPPRPQLGSRTGRLARQLSRLFERGHTDASKREQDVEQARGEKSGGAIVEGMYEHAPGPLLPMQAYKSMLKRSNQSLRQHLNDSQVAIHVTETTEVVMDDIPPPRAPKSKRRHRKPQEEPAQTVDDEATEDSKP